jgi:hypothetical protein
MQDIVALFLVLIGSKIIEISNVEKDMLVFVHIVNIEENGLPIRCLFHSILLHNILYKYT